MAAKVYIILAIFYFVIGLAAVSRGFLRTNGLKLFIFISAILPIVSFTQQFHFKSQISVYNFFFIGLYLIYLIKILKPNHKIFNGIIAALAFLIMYIIHYSFFIDIDRDIVNIAKDIKPILTIITAFLFVDYFKEDLAKVVTKRLIDQIILWNFIVSSIIYFLMYKYDLNVRLSGDAYYKYNELRYLSLGTYFCIFYLFSVVIFKVKPSKKNLVFALLPLLYTGNRSLLVTLLLLTSIYFLFKLSLKKIIFVFSGIFIALVGFVYLVRNAVETSALYRFKELTDLVYIREAMYTRISPFTEGVGSMNGLEVFVGKGLGYTFFIPWFVYRVEIEDYNIYLDNLYLTLVAKFGVFCLVYFYLIYNYLKIFTHKKQVYFYFAFFMLIALTNAIVYQYYFIWLLILFVFPFYKGFLKRGELS